MEQAKGFVAERLGLSIDEAFAVLRRYARDHNRKLTDVACDALHGRLDLTAAPLAAPERWGKHAGPAELPRFPARHRPSVQDVLYRPDRRRERLEHPQVVPHAVGIPGLRRRDGIIGRRHQPRQPYPQERRRVLVPGAAGRDLRRGTAGSRQLGQDGARRLPDLRGSQRPGRRTGSGVRERPQPEQMRLAPRLTRAGILSDTHAALHGPAGTFPAHTGRTA
jgi:ANTAR domain